MCPKLTHRHLDIWQQIIHCPYPAINDVKGAYIGPLTHGRSERGGEFTEPEAAAGVLDDLGSVVHSVAMPVPIEKIVTRVRSIRISSLNVADLEFSSNTFLLLESLAAMATDALGTLFHSIHDVRICFGWST